MIEKQKTTEPSLETQRDEVATTSPCQVPMMSQKRQEANNLRWAEVAEGELKAIQPTEL